MHKHSNNNTRRTHCVALRHIVIAFLTVMLSASCTDSYNRCADRAMARAEAQMDTAPDSALLALDSIDSSRLHGERRRALHALLLTQARDKNYIDQTSDSLLLPAVEYFDSHEDVYHRMLTHYYHGIIFYQAKEFTHSLIELLQSEEIASKQADYQMAGLSNRYISRIYRDLELTAECLDYATKSEHNFKQSHNKIYVPYSLIETSEAYIRNLKFTDALNKLDSAEKLICKYNQSYYATDLFLNRGRAYFGLQDYTNALKWYEKAIETDSTEVDAQTYMNIITCYALIDGIKTAKEKSNEFYNYGHISNNSYYLNQLIGNYKDAYSGVLAEYHQLDSLYQIYSTQNLTTAIRLASEAKNKMNITQINRSKERVILLSVIIALLLIGSVTAMIIAKKMRDRKHAEYIADVQQLNDEMNRLTRDNTSLKSTSTTLLTVELGNIENTCNAYYLNPTEDLKKPYIVELTSHINNIRNLLDKGNILYHEIDNANDHILTKFVDKFNDFSKKDIYLFTLLVAGFSPRSCAVLLNTKIENYYVYKNRLKSKITASESIYSNLFLDFFKVISTK